jgi:chemotaxis protein CheX
MPETMIATSAYTSEDFLSEENIQRADETVYEVYAQMLGLEICAIPPPVPEPGVGDERTALVGYSGAMRGCCEVQMNAGAAAAVASAMLGGIPVDDEDSLDDAVGEICNMIGGGWKDRVPNLASLCSLSPPTVITGRAYKVHMSRPSLKVARAYRFGEHVLFLIIRREHTGA